MIAQALVEGGWVKEKEEEKPEEDDKKLSDDEDLDNADAPVPQINT